MSRLVFIHLDSLNATWGNGTLLTEADSPKRPNLSANWETDASGNILNNSSGGSIINYNSGSGTFTTDKPVRVVLPSNRGTTSYVDFATANSALTFPSITSRPSIIGGEIRDDISQSKYVASLLGWLDSTPKQSDGTEATTDTNAEYYEITILAKTITASTDFVGVGYKNVDGLNNDVNGVDEGLLLGGCMLLDPTTGGLTTGTINGVGSAYGMGIAYIQNSSGKNILDKTFTSLAQYQNFWPGFINSFDTVWSGSISTPLQLTHNPNDILSVEFGNIGVGVVNRTTNDIESQESSSYFSSVSTELVAPMFIVNFDSQADTSKDIGVDDLGVIGFDNIVN